jgi:hypothetical protein
MTTSSTSSWRSIGLAGAQILSLAVDDQYVLAGMRNGGVWRRPLAELLTNVNLISDETPADFKLEQNFPNPFNPVTTISFRILSRSFVSLKVYDLLGREVATIVSEQLMAGNHVRQWNAVGMPSGVYFYRLQTRQTSGGQVGTFIETKKLVLLK